MIRAPHLGRGAVGAGTGVAATAGWFGRMARVLFGENAHEPSEKALVDQMVEAVVDAVEPRIRLRPRYRTWLAPGAQRTITHLRALARDLPEPRGMARAGWSDDPFLSTWFANPERMGECLGESDELRRYFGANPAARECCALLAMRYGERTVLGHALQGEIVVRDVQQTHVSFFDHRALAAGPDWISTRREIGRRIMLRLAQLSLIAAMAQTRTVAELETEKAMLGMRLRIARLSRDGAGTLTGKPVPTDAEIQALERELDAVSKDHMTAKRGAGSLDRYLEQIDQVLTRPEQHVALARVPLCVDRMGVKQVPGSNPEARAIERAELRLGDGLIATIALVQVARSEIPPETDAVEEAARRMGMAT